MSIFIKKFVLILVAAFFGLVQAPLSSYGSTNTSWELSKAFGEAIRDQESSNKSYFVLFFIIVILLGVIIIWYITQRRHPDTNEDRSQVWLDDNNSFDKTQRAWMRLSFNQDLLFSQGSNDHFQKGKVVNISGSGLLFATDQDIKLNDKLTILLELNPGKKLNLTGKVVRIIEKTHEVEKPNLIGVEFINIRRGDQDSIIKMILEKQSSTMLGKKDDHKS